MTDTDNEYRIRAVETTILTIRGQKVILDADLARIYGVPTKALNQAVKRNTDRFPEDFVFALSDGEKSEVVTNCDHLSRLRFSPVLPYAFTEHGAIMAATVLNSPEAVRMSVFVVRAFVKMREYLLNRAELEKRLADIEKTLLAHDAVLRDVYQRIRPLLLPTPEPPRKQIGFGTCHAKPDGRSIVKERRAGYIVKRKGK